MKVKRYFMKFGEGIAEMPNGEHWVCSKQIWNEKPKELETSPLPHGVIDKFQWINLWAYRR